MEPRIIPTFTDQKICSYKGGFQIIETQITIYSTV